MAPIPPQPHFPSRYLRPTVAPTIAVRVETADGAQLATYVYGRLAPDVTPVLFLHGNGEESGIFGPTIDAIVESGRAAIALDSRAQGKSTRGVARLTYELFSRDAIDALDALDIDRVHALGFSDGGIECLLLARDWPHRVASITALGANLTPEGVLEEPGWDLAGTIEANRAWASYWSDPGSSCERRPVEVDRMLLTPRPDKARETAELLQLMLDEPHIEATSLASLSCPATIVAGEFDCICGYETALIARHIPDARLLIVPEAFHSLPKNAPRLVTALLRSTIERAEGKDSRDES